MWAQLISTRLKPGKDQELPKLFDQDEGHGATGLRPSPVDGLPGPEGSHPIIHTRRF